MPKMKVDELNQLHQDAKALDREVFAEMRSNILLVAGEHYSRRMVEWWNRSRTTTQATENYKLRITKNWLHRAHRLYVSSILGQAPGTVIAPRNDMELQDQKSAELCTAVWAFLREKAQYKRKLREWVSDFCGIGEAVVKIFFDPNKGELKGYEPTTDDDGNVLVDETGQPIPDEKKPVFTGEIILERIFAHNTFRDPAAKSMSEAAWIGIEKLESTKALKRRYKDEPDKLPMITEANEEFVVFDSSKGGYTRDKDQTMILEYYFRPSPEYPKGYFYITTKAGILAEGELPRGVFPIGWVGFDEHPSKARATSMVKVARPWQAEINRASSQVAMHQVTISEDKILYQAGTKVSQGALLPGVRGLTYQGAPPTILPGRSGEQYFDYIAMQEAEMNRALMLDMLDEDKLGNLDPFALLFRSMTQSHKFSSYSAKFGEFLVWMTETALTLAKFYLDDDVVIAAVGRAEAINLAEFRSTSPLSYQVKVEEQADTIETRLGSQLVTNQILQYAGQQLNREDLGKLISNMPFGNWKDTFEDFTLDTTNAKNDFLAIERGEVPKVSPKDNSAYVLKQVAKRMKQRDFGMLQPEVQQLYKQYEQYHTQKEADELAAQKAAESEFIPTGGAMIAADMYIPNEDPQKTPKRVRVPYQALDWLLKMLEQQGMSAQAMEQMNQAQVAEISQQLMQGVGALPPAGLAS